MSRVRLAESIRLDAPEALDQHLLRWWAAALDTGPLPRWMDAAGPLADRLLSAMGATARWWITGQVKRLIGRGPPRGIGGLCQALAADGAGVHTEAAHGAGARAVTAHGAAARTLAVSGVGARNAAGHHAAALDAAARGVESCATDLGGVRARARVWLTHDVDYPAGIDRLPHVLDLERARGLTSAVFLLARGPYAVTPSLLDRLTNQGMLIGMHGLGHDLSLARRLPARLDGDLAEALSLLPGARAFRAPGLRASPDLLAAVARAGIAIDSSTSGAPHGVMEICHPVELEGGVTTWPVTLRDDQLLRERDLPVPVAVACAEALLDDVAAAGGWFVLDTHPEVLALAPDFYPSLLDRWIARRDVWFCPADPRAALAKPGPPVAHTNR